MSFCAFGWDVTLCRQLVDATDCWNYTIRATILYICAVCMRGVGDEKHLVFECSALNGIRLGFSRLFTDLHMMSSFMNQTAQRDVMQFITDCLRTHP